MEKVQEQTSWRGVGVSARMSIQFPLSDLGDAYCGLLLWRSKRVKYTYTGTFKFVGVNHTPRPRVYQSEWCSGKALALKSIGLGFAPTSPFDAFIIINHIWGLIPARVCLYHTST